MRKKNSIFFSHLFETRKILTSIFLLHHSTCFNLSTVQGKATKKAAEFKWMWRTTTKKNCMAIKCCVCHVSRCTMPNCCVSCCVDFFFVFLSFALSFNIFTNVLLHFVSSNRHWWVQRRSLWTWWYMYWSCRWLSLRMSTGVDGRFVSSR